MTGVKEMSPPHPHKCCPMAGSGTFMLISYFSKVGHVTTSVTKEDVPPRKCCPVAGSGTFMLISLF